MKRTHTVMSKKLRQEVGEDPEYGRCALLGIHGHECGGRITRSHDVFVAGRKVQKRWAILPLCAKGHGVDEYQDAHTEESPRTRLWVALNRATDEELGEFPKAGLMRERELLNREYGEYVPPPVREVWKNVAPRNLRPFARRPKLDVFEREVRAYARTNGCAEEEAREMLMTLV